MVTEKELEDLILAFHRKLIAEIGKEAERLHFTPSQLQVLHVVLEEGNPTMKAIAVKLNITPPSVTSSVESLCTNGFLVREEDEKDRRSIRVSITPKTLKTFSSLKDAKLDILKRLFLKLSGEDKDALRKILQIIINE